ncbi:hypothetical protein BB558_002289 [Smittium angustum]|uniref:Uncharacterized protein n=1 Tax=Smittium angustum TaxID=133377 RepID=A0A2U1J940_SMIAN|nr:hypothetical protein BB558_002289 [Smittium angustum]
MNHQLPSPNLKMSSSFGSASGTISDTCLYNITDGLVYLALVFGPIYSYYVDMSNKTIISCQGDYPPLNLTDYGSGINPCFDITTENNFYLGLNKTFCGTPMPEVRYNNKSSSSSTNSFPVKLVIFLLFTIWILISGM